MCPLDARRFCQYHTHGRNGIACNTPLRGRGRHRWCKQHAIQVRQQQRRARAAADVRRWRSLNVDTDRLRRFIHREAMKLADAGYSSDAGQPSAAITRRLQKTFGDRACGPDTRWFGHVRLENGFHAYVVFECDSDNQVTDVLAEAFSDIKLPVPRDCIELDHASALSEWVKHRFQSFPLWPCCSKPYWWSHPADTAVNLPLPHPPGRKEHFSPRISACTPFPPGKGRAKNPGRRLWEALVHGAISGQQRKGQ
jgi:hypothetical protein